MIVQVPCRIEKGHKILQAYDVAMYYDDLIHHKIFIWPNKTHIYYGPSPTNAKDTLFWIELQIVPPKVGEGLLKVLDVVPVVSSFR